MKKVSLTLMTAFVICIAVAVAQDTNSSQTGSQGTTGSSPSASQVSTSQGSAPASSQGGEMKSGEMKSDKDMKSSKGEKTLKGCIKQENGAWVLEEGKGKEVNLTGADVSAHANHEVKVHGSYESAASPAAAGGEKGNKTFNVTSVDMVSDTCTMGKKSSKSMDKGSMDKDKGSSTQPPQ